MMREGAWEWKEVDIQDVKEAKLAESIAMNVDDKGEVENYSQASDLHD